MSGLGELDRSGTPSGAGPEGTRSEEWLTTERDGGEREPVDAGPDADTDALTGPDAGSDTDPGAVSDTGSGALRDAGDPDTRRDAGDSGALRDAAARRDVGDTDSTGAVEAAAAHRPAPVRRAGADPVKALMHRHHDLCERAVDPLEIAAGLEAHGVTDRTAARFRHRDVFSLAEEMYARVPRDGETPPRPAPRDIPRTRADWVLLTLLPGALCTATVAGLHVTHGQARLAVAAAGVLGVALGVRAALIRGPLATRTRTHPNGTGTWTSWLLAYALLGDGLLAAALAGGPDALPDGTANAPWPLVTAPVLALAWACAPAAWSAHLLAVRARRKLTASRRLEDFAASVRPLLLGTFALFGGALCVLLAVSGSVLGEAPPYAQTATLGALLLLARLLTVHGFTHAPRVVLIATAAAQAVALATVFAARLPGCELLSTPVRAVTDTWGPGGIQTLVCGMGALTLLIHATRTLTRASAHARPGEPR